MVCDMRPARVRRDVADEAWLQIQAQIPDIIVRRPLVLAVVYFHIYISYILQRM